MDGAILSLSTIGAVMVFTITAVARKKIFQHLPQVGLFLAVYWMDNLIHLLVNHYPELQVIPNGSYQNSVLLLWSAKLYSALACLAIVYLFKSELSPGRVGLTLQQKPGSFFPCFAVMTIAGCVAAILGLGFDRGLFNLVLLLYMAVMPGLNEELVYRGLLLGILNKIFPRRWLVLGAQIGWGAVLTALLFGLLHGFWIEAGWSIHIRWYPVLFSCLTGALFAWLRERSGSLLFPFFTHGVIDCFIFLSRMTG